MLLPLVRALFRFVEAGYRVMPSLGPRPLVLLDSALKQMDWFGFGALTLQSKALLKGMFALHHSVPLPAPGVGAAASAAELNEMYQGVPLFEAIEYSLYVSLDIARHEFDPTDPRHACEAGRWLRHAKVITDDLLAYLARVRPRAVVYSQGYFVEGVIARHLAQRLFFQIYALENTFHSRRMICEPTTGISVNRNSALAWFELLASDGPTGDDVTWMTNLMSQIDAAKRAEHASPAQRFAWPDGRKRVLFIAQCFTDSSVLFGTHGPYATVEIVQALVRYATMNGVFVLVKLHPKEKGGKNPLRQPYNQLTLRRLLESGMPAHGQNHRIDDANEFATQQLMRDADVVVTINSQGGLEAQAFGKEVVLLGQSFYDRLGTTWNLTELSSLPATLDAILNNGKRLANPQRIAQFLRIYFDAYCIEKNAGSLATAIRDRMLPQPAAPVRNNRGY